ncbi:MAG: phosphoglucomutase [Methanosarcinales archaeon]|nr:phosphoglucomutase [Methanosarcinales archaeon]
MFRAYDVRGIYGTELTEGIAKRIGSAFGSYLKGGAVTLGRDTRHSGPSLQEAFLEGLLETGCQVESYGVIPISIISFVTMKDRRDASAYISASHNPPEYNGIRFRTGDGYGLLYHETKMMDIYQSGSFRRGQGVLMARDPQEAIARYADFVAGKLHFDRKLKVVLDMGNGSACTMAPLYQRLGFDGLVINGREDGSFSGRGPAPNEESLQEAARTVVARGADYGVGFDPDADRGIVIDDKGRVLPPEKVAIILAKRRYRPGDLVISGFDCSMILERELKEAGIRVERERVGDVYVANRVQREGAVLGVERSGHFFLPEFQYSDDPFSMSLAIGEIISEGQKLSSLADQIPDYPYVQKSVRLSVDPAQVMKVLEERLRRLEPDTLDGIKVKAEDHTVLIRPSNTEPLVRLYVETTGQDPGELVARYEKMVHEAIRP